MLLLEQYIEKRKKEDELNEFDETKKIDNIHLSIEYIFEYFNVYLPSQGTEDRSSKGNKLLLKYEHEIRDYSEETQKWLYNLYFENGHKMDRVIRNYLYNCEGFLLAYQEHEFRAILYDCYAQISKKYPCIKEQTEELYGFLKDYHYKESVYAYNTWKNPVISEKMSEWMENTWVKYRVNISHAIARYIQLFSGNQSLWPAGTKIKTDYKIPGFEFEYNHAVRTNRFNIVRFYGIYGNKPFLKGMKKQIEFLMLYHWAGTEDETYRKFLEENPNI